MKMLKSAFLIFAAILSLDAAARTPVAIINFDNVSVATSNGKPVQAVQVSQAIQAAAGARNWTIATQSDGKLLATLHVRGKHTIVVAITYAADKYSLSYNSSVNMNYGIRDGLSVIHPFYNKWVQELKESIRVALIRL